MVGFMIEELQRLAQEAYPDDRTAFGLYEPKPQGGDASGAAPDGGLVERPWMSRYRYVSELYIAALLYYTNKFGGEEADQEFQIVRDRLFAWAYHPRVNLMRVAYRSVDIHAHPGTDGRPTAFAQLRHSGSGRISLEPALEPYSDSHEVELRTLLKKLGAE
jgi:hypothetical protein